MRPVDIGASPLIPSSVIMLLSENSPNSGSRYEGMGARCVDPSQSGMLRILSTQAPASRQVAGDCKQGPARCSTSVTDTPRTREGWLSCNRPRRAHRGVLPSPERTARLVGRTGQRAPCTRRTYRRGLRLLAGTLRMHVEPRSRGTCATSWCAGLHATTQGASLGPPRSCWLQSM